jgi:hypothetical protein
MRPSHENKTTIVVAAFVQVDETLKTTKTWSFRVLVLMGPSGVWGGVLPVRPLDVDDVKGDDEVLGIVDPA